MTRRAIIAAFARYRSARVVISVDEEEVFRGRLLIFVVANGRFFGAGLEALPQALLTDGVLDMLLAGEVSLWTLLTRLPQIRTCRRR